MKKESLFKQRSFNEKSVSSLMAEGYPPLLARILSGRNIEKGEELNNDISQIIPISHLTNVVQMAEIIADAIIAGKKFKIVADYDSDGATSCAIVLRAMRGFFADIDYMVPNRFKHGYGLSRTIINEIVEAGDIPDYIITVDNGIASVDGIDAANEHNIKVLVTDHHLQGDVLPKAECIVNPNQKSCTFPSKNLAGCGVAWYTMLAVQRTLRNKGYFLDKKEFPVGSLLDFVALGTVADVVPLDRNNRILVERGLKQIRDGKSHAGIYALLEVSGRNFKTITSTDFGFVLGPRINAAGRMDDISIGIEALCADDAQHATQLAHQLDDLNRERKDVEQTMQNTALLDIEMNDANVYDNYTLVMHHPDWHEGVIGILASRLKDKFYRPVIVFSDAHDDNGNIISIKGSCRSIPPLNIRNALDLVYKARPDIIQKFGGHAMAAGIGINPGCLEIFKEEFEKAVQSMIPRSALDERVETDGALTANEISIETAEYLKNLPWGQGFPPPTFHNQFRVIQQECLKGKHMKLRLELNGQVFTALKWKCVEPFPPYINAQYGLNISDFNGKKDINIMIDRWETIGPEADLKVQESDFNFDKENGMSF